MSFKKYTSEDSSVCVCMGGSQTGSTVRVHKKQKKTQNPLVV